MVDYVFTNAKKLKTNNDLHSKNMMTVVSASIGWESTAHSQPAGRGLETVTVSCPDSLQTLCLVEEQIAVPVAEVFLPNRIL